MYSEKFSEDSIQGMIKQMAKIESDPNADCCILPFANKMNGSGSYKGFSYSMLLEVERFLKSYINLVSIRMASASNNQIIESLRNIGDNITYHLSKSTSIESHVLTLIMREINGIMCRDMLAADNIIKVSSTEIIDLKGQLAKESKKKNMYKKQVSRDELTGIPNRRFCEKIIARYKKKNIEFTYALLDIDNFKKVNDTLGHYAGDLLLTEIAQEIKNKIGLSGYVFRIGGEEFAIILKNTLSNHIIDDVRESIATKVFNINGTELKTSVSIGCCSSANSEFRTISDDRLYDAKKGGKNMVKYE